MRNSQDPESLRLATAANAEAGRSSETNGPCGQAATAAAAADWPPGATVAGNSAGFRHNSGRHPQRSDLLRPKLPLQFTLGTLLFGMLIFAIFFGYSGLWWRRVVSEQQKSTATIRRLQAALESERQSHRATQARLLVAESQLRDAVGVQLGRQLAEREKAERELKMLQEQLSRGGREASQPDVERADQPPPAPRDPARD